MTEQTKQTVSYPPNSIGSLIHPQVMTLKKDTAVSEVITSIRETYKESPEIVYYLYVTDETYRLIGVLNLRDLLLSDPSQKIDTIMKHNVISIQATQNKDEAVTIIKKHNYLALPVVDAEGHFLGVVVPSDILPLIEEEASDNIQKIFGAGKDERLTSPAAYSIRKRLPWLLVNLPTVFITAFVVGFFESMITRLAVLAVLLPIVASQCTTTGTQTLAVVIRGLALCEVSKDLKKKIIKKELLVGLINGFIVAVITGLLVLLWKQNIWLAVVIALAMQIAMILSVLAGVLIPILLKSVGHDPAQASAVLLSTITDIVGFGGFLLLAYLFTSLIQKGT